MERRARGGDMALRLENVGRFAPHDVAKRAEFQ
jgi:hypothetical protein